jgi:hypothetical protein
MIAGHYLYSIYAFAFYFFLSFLSLFTFSLSQSSPPTSRVIARDQRYSLVILHTF